MLAGLDLEARASVAAGDPDVAKSLCSVFAALNSPSAADQIRQKPDFHLELACVNDGCLECGQDFHLLTLAGIPEGRFRSIAVGEDVGLSRMLYEIL